MKNTNTTYDELSYLLSSFDRTTHYSLHNIPTTNHCKYLLEIQQKKLLLIDIKQHPNYDFARVNEPITKNQKHNHTINNASYCHCESIAQRYTAQKMKFSMKDFVSKCDQTRVSCQIFNGKLHFLCSDANELTSLYHFWENEYFCSF